MSHKFEQGKDVIIEAVVEKLLKKEPESQAVFCAQFARQFLNTVALDDLRDWSIDGLYGAVVNFWSLIQTRSPLQTKIRIYNPDYERDGWQITHTVIEVICDDMPFLVDSLRMVLNRMGLALHLIVHMGGIRVTRDANHDISGVLPRQGEVYPGVIVEAPVFLEIDRQTDKAVLEELHRQFEHALQDNRAVTQDWLVMRQHVITMKLMKAKPF